MNTLDDLHEVLVSRERHAPELATMLDCLYAGKAPNRRSRPSAPVAALVAAAAVVVLAVGAVLLATTMQRHRHSTVEPVSPGKSKQVRWSFSTRALAGATVTRTYYEPGHETAEVSDGTLILVYHPGAFDTTTIPTVPGAQHAVTVNGKAGVIVLAARERSVIWQYAPRAWAVVSGDPRTATEARLMLVARAVRFGSSDPITEPFRVEGLPENLSFQAASATRMRPHCLGYGSGTYTAGVNDVGSVLTICRAPHAQVGSYTADTNNRTVVSDLPDGTALIVQVDRRHLDEIDLTRQRHIAAATNTSPAYRSSKTWLPVLR